MKLKPIIFLGVAAMLAACSSNDEPTTPKPEKEEGNQEEVVPPPSRSESEIVESHNKFAFNLFNAVLSDTEQGENVVIAPFNCATVLAMLANGAEGTTLDELCEALGVGKGDIETLNALYKRLITTLPGIDERTSFAIHNSAWASSRYPLLPAYRETVSDVFGAQTFDNINFKSQSDLNRINEWISNATSGKIQNLLTPDMTSGMEIALISANLFKGVWTKEFDQGATYDDDFMAWTGEIQKVPTMHRLGDFSSSYTDNVSAARLTYGNGTFRMTLITTGYGKDVILTQNDWTELEENGFKPRNWEFSLPLFKTETKKDLHDILKGMNMENAFAMPGNIGTQYTKISTEPMFVDNLIHNAIVEVNEKGTEATGVTVGGIMPSSVSYKVDSPFIFVIDEVSTGTILFMGKVNKIE